MIAAQNYGLLRLDGQTPQAKRQDLIDKFNRTPSSKHFVFLLSAKAGGLGVNLIGASRLVMFDIDWNPATDKQAMARIHRDGQKRPCFIYRLIVQGAIEEKIHQRQVTKTELSDALVDSKKTAQGFTTEELRDLFRLDETEACGTHDLLGCECRGMGNTQVLPESTDDDVSTQHWGSTMADPLADDDSEAQTDTPERGTMMTASQLMKAQESGTKQMLHRANGPKKAKLALMQYLHIDAKEIVAGNDELVSLIEDPILLEVAKNKKNHVGFIFSKTSA
jgi:DNA repair and recombination protein RAD54B